MIPYEEFGTNVEAHLAYAFSLPAPEALDVLERRLSDDSWKRAPIPWFGRFENTVDRHGMQGDAAVAALRAAFLAAIRANKLDDAGRQVLPELCGSYVIAPTLRETEQLVDWFVREAGPGDASIAAEMLLRGYERTLTDALVPLEDWLIENGPAELRSRRRLPLLVQLLFRFEERGVEPSRLASLLRYVAVNADAGTILTALLMKPALFLGAMERILIDDVKRAPLVVDLSVSLGPSLLTYLFEVDSKNEYPQVRACVVRALTHGDNRFPATAWRRVLTAPCRDRLNFLNGSAVLTALEAIRLCSHGDEVQAEWARTIVAEAARVFDLERGIEARVRSALIRWIGRDDSLTVGVGESLRARVSTGLTAELLREPLDHGVVQAAILAIPDRSEVRTSASDDLDADVLQLFNRLLNAHFEPVFGVDFGQRLAGVSRVELANLPNEEKVSLAGDTLAVDGGAIHGMLRQLRMDRDAKLALAATYLLHELVHVIQGAGAKSTVEKMRAVGGETTLMHVDLGADHAAALGVAQVVPRWPLNWLKDLQGQSLIAYPASPYNTPAGRARKADRLVGLRLDFLARRTGAIARDQLGEGYAFADFGPAGGAFLTMVCRPPFAVVRASSITSDEAEALGAAADPGFDDARLTTLDAIVLRMLGEASAV